MQRKVTSIKSVVISHVDSVVNEGTSDEAAISYYNIEVRIYNEAGEVIDGTDEREDTLQDAEAYAAEVCQRPLKVLSLGSMLDRR